MMLSFEVVLTLPETFELFMKVFFRSRHPAAIAASRHSALSPAQAHPTPSPPSSW